MGSGRTTKPRGPGAAGKIRQLHEQLDVTWEIVDYWKVRALRAEGHDIPARLFPAHALSHRAPSDGNAAPTSSPLGAVHSESFNAPREQP